jgi:hypothetical protein
LYLADFVEKNENIIPKVVHNLKSSQEENFLSIKYINWLK